MFIIYYRVAPYQIALHDGRLIYAPQDTEQVIRLRVRQENDPPSPEVEYPLDDEDDEYDQNLEEMTDAST